jgi:predicted GNAT family N-acyltransferase
MELSIRHAAFGTDDFEACLAIRIAVFVGEQNVPAEEERDALDETAKHFLVLHQGEPAGTARTIVKAPGLVKIGRVAVSAPFRKSGVGAAVMRAAESAHPGSTFVLDAQVQALPFYEKLGYVAEGEMFMEAGIPHRHMIKPSSFAR